MNDALVRLQNHALTDENRALVMDIIGEQEHLLEQVMQMLVHARIRKETACVEKERAHRPLADAETAEIIAAQAVNALQKTRKEVEDAIFAQKALLHPIRRLPSDILLEIFAHCQYEDAHRVNMRNNIYLSSVCRSWRLAACSLGRLWGDIYLDPLDTKGLHIIDIFLKRTDARLNLFVHKSFWEHINDTSFNSLMKGFPFSRVQYLIIDSNPHFSRTHLVKWLLCMSNVKQLMIYGCDISGDVLTSFPNLQILHLYDVNLQFTTSFTLPKLTAVKWKMTRGTTTPSSLAEFMRRVPNLESFSLNVSRGPNSDLSSTQVAFPPLDALVQLEVEFPYIDVAILSFLRSDIHLPSLQHLILRWTHLSEPLDRGFFVRHGNAMALNKLTIRLGFPLKGGATEKSLTTFSVLRHLQRIAHLRVEVPSYFTGDWEYPQQFTVRLCNLLSICVPDPLFPKLQLVSLVGYIQPPIGALVQLAYARRMASSLFPETISCIQSFTFDCFEPLTVEERRRLDAAIGH